MRFIHLSMLFFISLRGILYRHLGNLVIPSHSQRAEFVCFLGHFTGASLERMSSKGIGIHSEDAL